MATKEDFTEDEWTRMRRAPMVASLAISVADPGGLIEMTKETGATLRAITVVARGEGRSELVKEIAQAYAPGEGSPRNVLGDFKPSGPDGAQQILDELKGVIFLAKSNATEEEAADLRAWLLEIAQGAAEAAKEGGFLGFRAELVSAGEQEMLDKLRASIG